MKTMLRSSARIALGIAMLAASLAPAASMLAGRNTAANARKAAPEFALKDAEGAPIKLSDYKGKVVLLNFWATWCHGCKLEIPWFMEFEKKYKDGGLAVIGVAMDDDGWKVVKPYAEEKKMNYTVVVGGEDLGKLYGLDAMPMTVLIDREGRIAATYSGMVDREKCESEIRTLLQEGGKSAAK